MWARLQNTNWTRFLFKGFAAPPAPLWWCGSAAADSELRQTLYGCSGPVDSSGASAGTSETSPDHRSPGSVRRRSQTDGCWCAWEVGGEEQGLAEPPSAPYVSPSGGTEGQVLNVVYLIWIHLLMQDSLGLHSHGADIFRMTDCSISHHTNTPGLYTVTLELKDSISKMLKKRLKGPVCLQIFFLLTGNPFTVSYHAR